MSGSLTEIAIKYGTDKWGAHFYTPHYEGHFGKFRHNPITFLEIGIGGYDNPKAGGRGLRMWAEWFTHPEAKIIGLDYFPKSIDFEDPRVKTFEGSQVDTSVLDELIRENSGFDIIVDDGSHRPEHVIETFEYLFPALSQNGIYAIEDTQTSYWQYGYDNERVYNPENPTYSYFKKIIDWINYAEIPIRKEATYMEKNIVAIHFYHNMIFIQKGKNDEPSNSMPLRREISRLEG